MCDKVQGTVILNIFALYLFIWFPSAHLSLSHLYLFYHMYLCILFIFVPLLHCSSFFSLPSHPLFFCSHHFSLAPLAAPSALSLSLLSLLSYCPSVIVSLL